jgi:hypothetical protein
MLIFYGGGHKMKKVIFVSLLGVMLFILASCLPVDEDSFLTSPLVKGYQEALMDENMSSEEIANKYFYFESGLTENEKETVYSEVTAIKNGRVINPRRNIETMGNSYATDLSYYPEKISKVSKVKISYQYEVPDFFTGETSWRDGEEEITVYKVGEDWYITYIYKDASGDLKSYPNDFLE